MRNETFCSLTRFFIIAGIAFITLFCFLLLSYCSGFALWQHLTFNASALIVKGCFFVGLSCLVAGLLCAVADAIINKIPLF